MFCQFCRALLGKMDVVRQLNFRQLGQSGGVKVVNGHAVFSHDLLSDLVVPFHVVRMPGGIEFASGGDGCGGTPDQHGAGGPELRHDLPQIPLVVCWRNLVTVAGRVGQVVLAPGAEFEVVQTEIEVDDVPGATAWREPLNHLQDAAAAGSSIAWDAENIGFASQQLADLFGVADANGVAHDHDARQPRVFLRGSLLRFRRGSRFGAKKGGHAQQRDDPVGHEEQGSEWGEWVFHSQCSTQVSSTSRSGGGIHLQNPLSTPFQANSRSVVASRFPTVL